MEMQIYHFAPPHLKEIFPSMEMQSGLIGIISSLRSPIGYLRPQLADFIATTGQTNERIRHAFMNTDLII
jgi:hypothetical protein